MQDILEDTPSKLLSSEGDFKSDAKIFKALCDEKRLMILELLRHGEKCACKLIEHTGMGQSALSYHMKILCESGLVLGRSEGKWVHYSLCPRGRKRAMQKLTSLTEPAPIQEKCDVC